MNYTELILEELQIASLKHMPEFNSRHEAYAVLLEELEEANSAIEFLQRHIRVLWSEVKSDSKDNELRGTLKDMETLSKNLVEESIKVGAMVEKFKRYLDGNNKSS